MLDENKLAKVIEKEYGIKVTNITPAKRGFFGETYRVQANDKLFFAKVDNWPEHKNQYRNSFKALKFLMENGADFAVGFVPTKKGAPCIDFNGGVLGIFPFANGENREDYPLEQLFERLCAMYRLNIHGVDIEKDDVPSCGYHSVKALLKKCSEISYGESIFKIIKENEKIIIRCEEKRQSFLPHCNIKEKTLHLTHGDAGGNCIISKDSFKIIDWDQARLAPIERDAWFFMQRWEQISAINNCLKPLGESLDSDWLCLYCYSTFFYYICEYLTAILSFPEKGEKYVDMLSEYFSSWVLLPIKKADEITPGIKR